MSTFLDRDRSDKPLDPEGRALGCSSPDNSEEPAEPRRLPAGLVELPPATAEPTGPSDRPRLAAFCFEPIGQFLGQQLRSLATALASRGCGVHLFTRDETDVPVPGVTVQSIGPVPDGPLLDQVREFTSRACNAFQQQFPPSAGPVTLLGVEWSSAPALSLLRGTRNLDAILSLHSLERQRSDMGNDLSKQIHEIEVNALRQTRSLLFHDAATAEAARALVPDCASRSVQAAAMFPAHLFGPLDDPGVVKARYQVGPLDPLILFVGDLDQRHGPDVLMRSVPAVLRNHPQARFVFVGDGELLWPLRVHARYLLLEPAVRLVGHVAGPALHDLFRAADQVVVPSREPTEWWPIQAAWAAGKPLVASNVFVEPLALRHEVDAVAVFPHESSVVWGIERLLYDAGLGRAMGDAGQRMLEERFGWALVARQLEGLIASASVG